MKKWVMFSLIMFSTQAFTETRVYSTDRFGNKQYHKGYTVVNENKKEITKSNSVGNKEYHIPKSTITNVKK